MTKIAAASCMDDTFRQLVLEEIPRLRRYARALSRDANSAEDLVQDCLARSLAKAHLWQPGTDMRAWLFTILHNQYVNQVRRSAREGNPIIVEDGDPLLTSSAHQNKSLMVRDLERALTRLAPEQRAVVLLVGLEGMRYEEVAEILDVPVGTVRSRLSRGREMLRYLMGFTVPAPGTPVPRVAKRRARPFSLERYIGERPSVRRALALGATA